VSDERPTPLTDANEGESDTYCIQYLGHPAFNLVPADFARTLESELAEMTDLARRLERERDAALAKLKTARDALKDIMADADGFADGAEDALPAERSCNRTQGRAQAALESTK